MFAKYYERITLKSHLHLSIHEIRSDNRVGPTLWSFNINALSHLNFSDLVPIKSTENVLGITVMARFDDHWKLFDISTTETDPSDNFPLIESRRIDFDLKLKLKSMANDSPGVSQTLIQSY